MTRRHLAEADGGEAFDDGQTHLAGISPVRVRDAEGRVSGDLDAAVALPRGGDLSGVFGNEELLESGHVRFPRISVEVRPPPGPAAVAPDGLGPTGVNPEGVVRGRTATPDGSQLVTTALSSASGRARRWRQARRDVRTRWAWSETTNGVRT